MQHNPFFLKPIPEIENCFNESYSINCSFTNDEFKGLYVYNSMAFLKHDLRGNKFKFYSFILKSSRWNLFVLWIYISIRLDKFLINW